MRRGKLRLGAAVIAVLALAGCVGTEPLPTLPPTPSSTPLFASEEEALAAAEEAYKAYQSIVDAALRDIDGTKLATVATGAALTAATDSVEAFRQDGRHQVGESSVTRVTAVDLSALDLGENGSVGQIYACLNLSAVNIVDADGAVAQSQVDVLPMIVALELVDRRLLVSEEDVWDGSNFCA